MHTFSVIFLEPSGFFSILLLSLLSSLLGWGMTYLPKGLYSVLKVSFSPNSSETSVHVNTCQQGGAGNPSPEKLQPQWRMLGHQTYWMLLYSETQQLQPELLWPTKLCVGAGQAATHHFWRTLAFFAWNTGQVLLALSPKQKEEDLWKHRALLLSICTFMGHLTWYLQDGNNIILMLMAHFKRM